MDINEKTTKKIYNRGKQIAESMFVSDVVMVSHISQNLEEDLKALAEKYSVDIDVNELANEIKKIKKGIK